MRRSNAPSQSGWSQRSSSSDLGSSKTAASCCACAVPPLRCAFPSATTLVRRPHPRSGKVPASCHLCCSPSHGQWRKMPAKTESVAAGWTFASCSVAAATDGSATNLGSLSVSFNLAGRPPTMTWDLPDSRRRTSCRNSILPSYKWQNRRRLCNRNG